MNSQKVKCQLLRWPNQNHIEHVGSTTFKNRLSWSFDLVFKVGSWEKCPKLRTFTLAPGCTCTRFAFEFFKFWICFGKICKKLCMYLTMLRTTMFFFEPKWHSMLPVQKWQISCQIWDPKFEFSDRKFVIFVQGAYYVISARKKTWWCATWSGTCVIYFGIFR